ncbi:heat shock factor 2-binding protein, partial [Biomphalaria pfeifferi]
CKNSEFLKLTYEAKFILSICGIITNVAASSQGREYLASCQEGCEVMNTFISFIGKAPNGKSAQIKILMLMSLYNFSINSKGIKFLCSKRDLIPLLAKHFKEEKDAENQLVPLTLCSLWFVMKRVLQSVFLSCYNIYPNVNCSR